MDGDTSDVTTGVVDSLNGETKPDPAKLAQSALIKQVSVWSIYTPYNVLFGGVDVVTLCNGPQPMPVFCPR